MLSRFDVHQGSFAAIAFVGCVFVGATGQEKPKSLAEPTPVPQQLRIRSQPDAPLRIASVRVTWAIPGDQRAVQAYVVVENISQRVVRAYTTRREGFSATASRACLDNPHLPAEGMLPGQKAGTSTWQGTTDADPLPEIWLDFVEFADGARWGADECQTGEWLDGWRAGGRMEGVHLLSLLRGMGADELIVFIKEQRQTRPDGKEIERKLPVAPPPGHSERWQAGFTAAAGKLEQDVIDGFRRGGAADVERLLTSVVDSSGKKEP